MLAASRAAARAASRAALFTAARALISACEVAGGFPVDPLSFARFSVRREARKSAARCFAHLLCWPARTAARCSGLALRLAVSGRAFIGDSLLCAASQ